MRWFSRFAVVSILALWVVAAGCSKETKKKEVATVAQDTMLLHDLAEANKNTAAAAAADNSLSTVMTANGSGSGSPVISGQTPQNRPSDVGISAGQSTPTPTTTTRPRLTVPTRANDAPAPTNVPVERSPASGDPCDSPSPANQRTCLNRSIVANDADLNRTYQELIAQSRKSGGSALEERIRQAQREWINERDANCRPQSQGGLWARGVARCLASYSEKRTAELQRTLAGLRGQ